MIATLLALFLGGAAANSVAVPDGGTTAVSSVDAGQLFYAVYAAPLPDGGSAPVWLRPDGGTVLLDKFPCAKRPKGVAANALGCLAHVRSIDGGTIIDIGNENVLQPGLFSGNGCKPTPCAIFSGDSPP